MVECHVLKVHVYIYIKFQLKKTSNLTGSIPLNNNMASYPTCPSLMLFTVLVTSMYIHVYVKLICCCCFVLGYAMENTSEDLFMSDDDGLSEPQLLALLDTVECEFYYFEMGYNISRHKCNIY